MRSDRRRDSTLGGGGEVGTEAAASHPGRRPYGPPRLLSSEPLELAAGTCSPPTEPFGKTHIPPSTCTQLGS